MNSDARAQIEALVALHHGTEEAAEELDVELELFERAVEDFNGLSRRELAELELALSDFEEYDGEHTDMEAWEQLSEAFAFTASPNVIERLITFSINHPVKFTQMVDGFVASIMEGANAESAFWDWMREFVSP